MPRRDRQALADLRGKGVVLNFWASWCKPCEEEAADLEAAWRKYKDKGIVFVGVDYLDQDPAAKRYLEKFDITFANGAGSGQQDFQALHHSRRARDVLHRRRRASIVGCRKIGPLTPAELDQRIAEIMPQ